jgi:hypothetical protein
MVLSATPSASPASRCVQLPPTVGRGRANDGFVSGRVRRSSVERLSHGAYSL